MFQFSLTFFSFAFCCWRHIGASGRCVLL